MKNYLIDTHAHVDMLKESVENVLTEMESFGVKKVIIPAVEEKTSDKIIEIAEKYENIYAMVGLFPSEAKIYNVEVENKILSRAKSKKVVAVGEIGLDYYWDKTFNDVQQNVFVRQIKLANKLNLPIVIHDRDAHKDTFDIIKEYNHGSKVLFHCFSGSTEFMKECVKEGWYIAIGGVVTFKNATKIKDVAKEVPLDKLVLETDSPYLTPVPFRGKENKPAYVKYVAEKISEIRNIDYNELVNITSTNAEEFFNI